MDARPHRRLTAWRSRRLRPTLRHLALPTLGFVALIQIAAPVVASSAPSGGPSAVESAVAAIERQLDEMGVAQGAYVVINGEQEQVAGFGAASSDTPFVIGSVSKSVTALAILQLVEQGLVELDVPVTDYIDWFTTADSTPFITIRHLLNQTSGLSTLDGSRDIFTPEISLEERVRAIENYEVVSEPGAAFNYSNLNYATLGLIIEEVSGLGYGEFVEEGIFAPLGMEHSYADFARARADGLAQGTITVFGVPVSLRPTAFPGIVPDGYLISTAADMALYARFQMGDGSFEGRRLISAENMALMHTPEAPSQGYEHLDHYAMGWRTGSIDGQALIGHDGNTFGFHANVALLPDIDAAVVVLMARNGAMVRGPENAGLEALIGGTPELSRSSTITWVVVDVVAVLLVLASVVFVMRTRRRRRMIPPLAPRRWPAILQVAAGVTVGAAVVMLMASMAGGMDIVGFRLLWALAPDMIFVALAVPLLLVAMGITNLVERRRAVLRRGMELSPIGEEF
jgi:CubicO group peptidase (beta-lactamase class C family)